tara:strand:- start:113 stop:331 length:219 start_codon:yes stop_codon:yes gene_type:complete
MKFLIEADVTFTRTYTVEAKSAEEALEIYREATDFEAIGEPDDGPMEEQGDTAVVYSADGTHTMLIDVADGL